MLEVAGHQVIRTCGMRAFQKNIVVRVGARLNRLRGPHPEAFLANSLQGRGYHFFIAREARPPDYFFVLGVNTRHQQGIPLREGREVVITLRQ